MSVGLECSGRDGCRQGFIELKMEKPKEGQSGGKKSWKGECDSGRGEGLVQVPGGEGAQEAAKMITIASTPGVGQ
jgi:hypothetical protein